MSRSARNSRPGRLRWRWNGWAERRPISPATRERVEAAIASLTYQPNAGARALAGRRTQVIGLVMPFGLGPEALPFIETITSCARERDHDVLLVTADEGPDGLRRIAGRSLCDAVVLMDVETDDARIPVAAALGIPVILIGVPDDAGGLHCVDMDFAAGGRMAVDELAACGGNHVVAVGHSEAVVARGLNFVGRFHRGAAAAADTHGIRYEVVTPPAPGRAGAAAAVDAVLTRGRPGIVVPGTAMVSPVLLALRDRGVEPGRDVAVVGLCTDTAAEETIVPVTNVSVEPRGVSRRAMQLLFSLLDGASTTAHVELVAPRLTRRETTLS